MATVVIELPIWGGASQSTLYPFVKRVIGSNFAFDVLRFSDTLLWQTWHKFRAVGYVSGDLTLRIQWYADTASSGDVVFGGAIACITPNTDTQDIETKSPATDQTVTDSHLGTTNQRLHEAVLTITNLDSIAADDIVFLQFYRDGTDGNDTLSGEVFVVGLQVEYTI